MKTAHIPSLNWLRVFEAAARCESFAKAAVELNMSAPAVSQQIKALEGFLGAQLFRRKPHSVELTANGRAFLPSIQHGISAIETTASGLFGRGRQETLYLHSVLIFAVGFLASQLAEFRHRHPEINLILTTGNSYEDFGDRFSDLQIVFGSPLSFGLVGDRLLGERLYPIAPLDISKGISSPQDLIQFPLIEVTTHQSGWVTYLEGHSIPNRDVQYIYADNTLVSCALSAGRSGIALARSPVSDVIERQNDLYPCFENQTVTGTQAYHLAYQKDVPLRRAAQAFRHWLLEKVAEQDTNER